MEVFIFFSCGSADPGVDQTRAAGTDGSTTDPDSGAQQHAPHSLARIRVRRCRAVRDGRAKARLHREPKPIAG